MAAFKALKSRYGSQLAELIYTPGGMGIKNGQPFRYTGQVARDHYDHVHVAFAGGSTALGQAGNRGDGLGRFTGDGLGSNARRIWSFLRGHGFSPAQAAGIIGNFQQESGLDPTASQHGGPGRGLAQWGGGRFAALQAFAAKRGKPWTDLNTQLQFMIAELGGPEASAGRALRGAHTVADATSIFGRQYERYGIAGDRLAPARAAYNAFRSINGATSTGGAGASTSGAASAAARVNPLDQKLATADLAIQQAKNQPATAVFAGGRRISSAMAQISALGSKRKLIGARIRSIRKALKGKLSPAKRLALTQELTQRLQEHSQLGTDIQGLRTPTAGDAGLGGSGGGGDITGGGDDPNQPLIDAQNAAAEAAQKLADAIKEHSDLVAQSNAEMKRQTDFAASARDSSNYQAWKALADVLSGQIVGLGAAGRSYTPGTGVAHTY